MTRLTKVSYITEIANVLAFVKSLVPEDEQHTSNSDLLPLVADLIDSALKDPDCDDFRPMLLFVISQLRLSFVEPNGRRYSKDLIVLAFLWKMTSLALYKKLQSIFILPSVRRLQQLSSGATVHANELNLSFMTTRVRALDEQEKFVLLMIDEVYSSARVEYQNGEFIGLTDDGEIAKTLLVFMVHSLKHSSQVCCCL